MNRSDFSQALVLVVAAGRGTRAGPGGPKQYRPLAGRPLLAHTLDRMAEALPGATLLTVIHADDREAFAGALNAAGPAARAASIAPAIGGETRQDSVRNGLETALSQNKKIVLIHDAARPFASIELIRESLRAAEESGAAAPGAAVVDTIREVDGAGLAGATLDRDRLRAIQTPQAFRYELILEAHRAAAGLALTDDCALAARAGHAVRIIPGEPANMKVTTAADVIEAERRLLESLPDIRVGQGYDVHGFEPGDAVWLGGVAIPHDRKLMGHSDADVLMHAVTDALLGAIAAGDIGDHFPPSDMQWKGAPSSIFLAHAARLVRERGGYIANVDANVIAERPKIGPHRDAIRAKLAEVMGIDPGRVGLKATTSEKLGFIGREEGIVAMASATVRLPLVAPQQD